MTRLFVPLLIAALPLSAIYAQSGAPVAKTDTMTITAKPLKKFEILDPAKAEPSRMLPPPPAAGSTTEALELAQLHQLISKASPERMAQAKWDDENEDPSIFDAVAGLSLKELPATWALLSTVQNDANLAANLSKKHFARTRPWGADATLPNCDAGKGKKPLGSYPSGHSTLGYSVGWALAQLMPEKAPAILARAHDYALSREICGVHFRSDTEASHVIGTYVAATVLADSRMKARLAAARAELARK
jgi:acid phosphatase (class A)